MQISVSFIPPPEDNRDLHSFPTRRSSDLGSRRWPARGWDGGSPRGTPRDHLRSRRASRARAAGGRRGSSPSTPRRARSEEHTSELQSQSNLVCRLLLEKKKAAE